VAEQRFVTYYRVSTNRQGRSGLGLDAQREAVRLFLAARPAIVIAEFVEVESGSKDDRPKLQEAIAACQRSKATLLIAKLDRLARSVAFVAGLMDGDTEFVAVDMPTPAGSFCTSWRQWRNMSDRSSASGPGPPWPPQKCAAFVWGAMARY
jgi:hypothetical protein